MRREAGYAWWLGCLLAAGLFVAPAFAISADAAPAGDAELRAQLAQLLESSNKSTPSAVQAVKQQYVQLGEQTSSDWRVRYVYALALINQRQVEEAAKILTELDAAGHRELPVRKTLVWAEMSAKQYVAALESLEALAASLPNAGDDIEVEAINLETVGFVGRMFGYLEGPAAGSVDLQTRLKPKTRILAGLTPNQRRAFSEGEDDVAARFADLTSDIEQTKAAALADQEKQREQTQKTVESKQSQVADESQSLHAKADQQTADLKQDLAEIDARLTAYRASFVRMDARAAALKLQKDIIQNQLNQFALPPASGGRPATSYEASALQTKADLMDSELVSLNRQAADIIAQGNLLLARRKALLLGKQVTDQDRAKHEAELQQSEKRVKSEAKQIPVHVSGNTALVRSLSAKLTVFSTYEEFPFESESQRMLALFK